MLVEVVVLVKVVGIGIVDTRYGSIVYLHNGMFRHV